MDYANTVLCIGGVTGNNKLQNIKHDLITDGECRL